MKTTLVKCPRCFGGGVVQRRPTILCQKCKGKIRIRVEVATCPFCAEAAQIVVRTTPGYVMCDHCGAQGPTGLGDYDSVRRWNEQAKQAPR